MCPQCKRTWRRIAWLALVSLALLVLLLVAFVGPWPRRVRTEPTTRYEEAGRRLASAGPESLTAAQLQAGRAFRSITPEDLLPLAGHSARNGARATGVASELSVKALALSNGDGRVLLLSADLLLLPRSFAASVRRELAARTGWPEEDVVLAVTHTHSAPSVWTSALAGRVLGGRGTRAYARDVAQAFVQAGLEAVETMQPSFWASFGVDVADLVRGRESEDVDGTLRGLLLRHLDGTSTFVLNFGANPRAASPPSRMVSGDYPGYLEKALAERPGQMTMFIVGATLGAEPLFPKATTSSDSPTAERPAMSLGRELARRVEARVGELVFGEAVALGVWARRCPLPPFSPRLGGHWQLSPAVPWSLGMRDEALVQIVRIGDVTLVALPTEFPASACRQLTRDGGGTQFWVTSLAGGYQGHASEREGDGLIPWCGPRPTAGIIAMLASARREIAAVPIQPR